MKLRVAYNNLVLPSPYHSINWSSYWALWFYLFTNITQSIHTHRYTYIYIYIYIYYIYYIYLYLYYIYIIYIYLLVYIYIYIRIYTIKFFPLLIKCSISCTTEWFNWIMVKIELSFKYSEFHVNYFTIFSLITALSTNVTKSLQCKDIFLSLITCSHVLR